MWISQQNRNNTRKYFSISITGQDELLESSKMVKNLVSLSLLYLQFVVIGIHYRYVVSTHTKKTVKKTRERSSPAIALLQKQFAVRFKGPSTSKLLFTLINIKKFLVFKFFVIILIPKDPLFYQLCKWDQNKTKNVFFVVCLILCVFLFEFWYRNIHISFFYMK